MTVILPAGPVGVGNLGGSLWPLRSYVMRESSFNIDTLIGVWVTERGSPEVLRSWSTLIVPFILWCYWPRVHSRWGPSETDQMMLELWWFSQMSLSGSHSILCPQPQLEKLCQVGLRLRSNLLCLSSLSPTTLQTWALPSLLPSFSSPPLVDSSCLSEHVFRTPQRRHWIIIRSMTLCRLTVAVPPTHLDISSLT